jgi:Ca2+-transporting ATPase
LQELSNAEWHSLSLDKVIEMLQTDIEKGLISIDVKRRLEEFGEKVISIKRGKNQLFSFLFKQPLGLILIIAGSITSLLQEWVDTRVIFGSMSP